MSSWLTILRKCFCHKIGKRAWYYEITKPTHSRFKSYFIKNLFAFKDYPETITITLEKCYRELRCLCKWITKILKIIRVPHEDAESPIVNTLFARLPVRPSKLVCNNFRCDTITQTVFIVQLSNFVQYYTLQQKKESYHIVLSACSYVNIFVCNNFY